MRARHIVLAAAAAAVLSLVRAAPAQYAPMGGPGGPYGDMMGASMMPGPSPYAPPAFAPAAYAGIGGPAPMGPGMAPMGAMPGDASMSGGPMYGGQGFGDYYDDGCGWNNRYFVFGEFLYLRPRNAEVAYAVPIDGSVIVDPTSPQVQVGPVRVADPDYAPGWRVGGGAFLGPRAAVAVTYTQFDRNTFDTVSLPGTGAVIRSLVSSPNPLSVGADGLDAAAILQTQFQLLDVDYKGLFSWTPDWQAAYVIGLRYANLEQHFSAGFAPATGFEEVLAESEFDGAGLKLGLEGLRMHPTTQFFLYGKGYASLVAGDFRTRYQFNSPTLANNTDVSWEAGRVITILDLETGVGWQNFTGNLRFTMGYMFSAWYNTVRVNEFINAVQTNNFVDPSDNFNGMISFDGLTAKIEVLW